MTCSRRSVPARRWATTPARTPRQCRPPLHRCRRSGRRCCTDRNGWGRRAGSCIRPRHGMPGRLGIRLVDSRRFVKVPCTAAPAHAHSRCWRGGRRQALAGAAWLPRPTPTRPGRAPRIAEQRGAGQHGRRRTRLMPHGMQTLRSTMSDERRGTVDFLFVRSAMSGDGDGVFAGRRPQHRRWRCRPRRRRRRDRRWSSHPIQVGRRSRRCSGLRSKKRP